MKWLPNALTILRCVLAFVVGWAILEMSFGSIARWQDALNSGLSTDEINALTKSNNSIDAAWSLVGLFTFLLAAVLDFLDGWLARKLNAESDFGRLLDPIADKILVAIPLLVAAVFALLSSPLGLVIALPCLAIISRDIFVTWLRFSKWGGSSTQVSILAKWKTAFEFIAIGFPLTILALERHAILPFNDPNHILVWLVMLYLAAALSLYTGYQYVRAAFSKPAP